MIIRFHGIDRHKKFSTISVLNHEGEEIDFNLRCYDLEEYIQKLGPEDAIILEASTGSFYWVDRIEATGASCYILDPHKFRIIRDSWNKTDRQDSRNMVKALWVYLVTGEFGIPTVYKPEHVIRELRKLFSHLHLLNRQIRMLKNNIQSLCTDNGIDLTVDEKNHLLSPKHGLVALTKHTLSSASEISIQSCLGLLRRIEEEKEKIQREIIITGEPLKDKVKLLMTIKGIAPMVVLVFLADVGDIKRFSSLRKMNAYLGLVPKANDSGGRSKPGHINRASRKLARTFLTQSVHHIANSSPYLEKYYIELIEKRGTGRARIALIRKTCGIMRRMLLTGECYRSMNDALFQRKVKLHEKKLEGLKPERKIA